MSDPLKYARTEEERRFLLKATPADLDPEKSFVRIFDNYLAGTRLRLRRMETPTGMVLVYKLGQKYHTADQESHQAIMTNMYLNEAEYNTLAKLGGTILVKRRYPYLYAGHSYGIDVFEGELYGLILAEIEQFPGQEIHNLPIPQFSVREITDDPRFSGGELAKLTRQEFLQWSDGW